ncbi:MAG: capsular biosynthesis protein CpsI [Gammaproteobacteria bacterium 28-57-27]|nr:MAG: capsular biosynthesis protein CpsI [Gammaproteobacteria bacterium 28-57-27]
MSILVTGAAGFIGFHTIQRLLARGEDVIGIDNLNDYYDVNLKHARLAQIGEQTNFRFIQLDLADRNGMAELFAQHTPERVIHLAAQAGVRYSIQNPHAYVDSNLIGFLNVLEGCRHTATKHLVFASSSSVYGLNSAMPYSVHNNVDHPISLYAASKKANELMAHSYAHLYQLPTTGLRFFTVYGPWGRPDMAYFKFTQAILAGHPIEVYNHGQMQRDFTYIDDIVEGILRVLDRPAQSNPNWDGAQPDPSSSPAPYRLYNIGNHSPVKLSHFVEILENALGQHAEKIMRPMQQGDVLATYADVSDLMRDTGFAPSTTIEDGLQRFVTWYRGYYH